MNDTKDEISTRHNSEEPVTGCIPIGGGANGITTIAGADVLRFTHIANPVLVIGTEILEVTGSDDSESSIMLLLADGRKYAPTVGMTSRYLPVPGDYLVRQEDGYEYLNPKAVFERKYARLPVPDAPAVPGYQQRVIDEANELNAKLWKLSVFLNTETCKQVDPAEQARMRVQYTIMAAYSEILASRIEAFA